MCYYYYLQQWCTVQKHVYITNLAKNLAAAQTKVESGALSLTQAQRWSIEITPFPHCLATSAISWHFLLITNRLFCGEQACYLSVSTWALGYLRDWLKNIDMCVSEKNAWPVSVLCDIDTMWPSHIPQDTRCWLRCWPLASAVSCQQSLRRSGRRRLRSVIQTYLIVTQTSACSLFHLVCVFLELM